MHYKYFLLLTIVFLAICVSGCRENLKENPLPERRNPGKVYSTFQAPEKPSEAKEIFRPADPNSVITLKDALVLSLLHNPELKAFSWEIRALEAKQLQVSLKPNPEIDVEVENIGGSGPFTGFDSAESTIMLSQLFETAYKREKRTKVASLEKELAGWDYESKRLDVFTEVNDSFIGVLAAQHRVALTSKLLGLSRQLLNTVTKRVEAGKDSPVEKTKAAVAFSNIQIQHEQEVENLRFAKKQLASTWGSGKAEFKSAAGKFKYFSQVPPIEELKGFIEQNPDLARWDSEIGKAKASVKLEKAMGVPDVTLSAGYKSFNEIDENAFIIGASIPLPLSDRNQGGKRQAIYKLAKKRQMQLAAHNKVQIEFDRAYKDLKNAYTQASALNKDVLKGAESVYQASEDAYRQGKLDYLNVLDAQRTLFGANGRYIEALASYHTAKVRLERLIGYSIDEILSEKKGI